MLYSHLFGKTSKTASSDSNDSTRLLVQAGFIRESVAGRYFILPLGWRVMQKIMAIVKKEMDMSGAQEMISPTLHPLELWKETNRTNTAGFELMQIKDRRGAEFALGGTAEEMFVDVVRKFTVSYRELPFHIYQFSTKFRDEMRARGGLLRVREFIMKDSYSFDRNAKDFQQTYAGMKDVYARIFAQIGIEHCVIVESDGGYIGGEYCHEFVMPHAVGESTYLYTVDGSYTAHEDVAQYTREYPMYESAMLPMQIEQAVRGPTMADGIAMYRKKGLTYAKYTDLCWHLKTVAFVDESQRIVLAVVRGDQDVNLVKLKNVTHAITLEQATEDTIHTKLHSVIGFLGPVNIHCTDSILIVADEAVTRVINACTGNNSIHEDLVQVNYSRDWHADIIGDITIAKEGNKAPNGIDILKKGRGIEVGNIFQLGYHYSNRMKGATYMSEDGTPQQYYMGCYGIGIGRTMAAVVESHHDAKGICWPAPIAPYTFHLVGLDLQDPACLQNATQVYNALQKKYPGEVLFDDRVQTRAGEKFADADLIGCPIRIVVSKRTPVGMVEWKDREKAETTMRTIDDITR